VLAGVWLAYICFGMTVASIAPLIAPLTRDLSISHSEMGTILGAWPLVYIAAAAGCGALTDRMGPRRTLVLALLIIAISGVLRGHAEGYWGLFLGVAVFGLGGPLVSIGAPKVVSLWFAGKERGLAMGIYTTGSSLGLVIAVSATNSLFMPLLNDQWRHVMFLYAAIALIAGCVWFAIGCHPTVQSLERRLAAEPKSPQLALFAELIRLREVRLILMMSTGVFFFNHALNNWLPEMLRTGGMDARTAGFWAAIPTAVGVVAALSIPRLATPGYRHGILAALFASAAAATLLFHSAGGWLLALGLVFQGIARGAMTSVTMLCLLEAKNVNSRYAGSAGGLYFTVGEMGGVLGSVMLGALYDATGGFAAGLFMLTSVCLMQLFLLQRLRCESVVATAT
jgi:MFS transporter, CP family, cyanate transporter